jgi:hypothetical protein
MHDIQNATHYYVPRKSISNSSQYITSCSLFSSLHFMPVVLYTNYCFQRRYVYDEFPLRFLTDETFTIYYFSQQRHVYNGFPRRLLADETITVYLICTCPSQNEYLAFTNLYVFFCDGSENVSWRGKIWIPGKFLRLTAAMRFWE